MDMQVHMSYCTPSAFEQLAFNYLGISVSQHTLYQQIKELLEEAQATPADIAGELTKTACAQDSLPSLVKFLQTKKELLEKARNNDQNDREKEGQN